MVAKTHILAFFLVFRNKITEITDEALPNVNTNIRHFVRKPWLTYQEENFIPD